MTQQSEGRAVVVLNHAAPQPGRTAVAAIRTSLNAWSLDAWSLDGVTVKGSEVAWLALPST